MLFKPRYMVKNKHYQKPSFLTIIADLSLGLEKSAYYYHILS